MDRELINLCIREAISEGTTRGTFRDVYIIGKLRKRGVFLGPEIFEQMITDGLLTRPDEWDHAQYCVTDKWLTMYG